MDCGAFGEGSDQILGYLRKDSRVEYPTADEVLAKLEGLDRIALREAPLEPQSEEVFT